MNNIKLAILKSFTEMDRHVLSYAKACESLSINYVVVDILKQNWISEIKRISPDGILVRVKGNIDEHKTFFDEVLFIISYELKIPIYPSYKELFLYENKRMYEYWLTANNYPHPKTFIFYSKEQAKNFIANATFPLVFKTNGGASSSGVTIINSKTKAKLYLHQVFGIIDQRLTFGKIPWRMKPFPVPKFGMSQKHYVLIQEYLPIKWEWRIIKIGESFFGHQKLLKGKFASGSDLVGWVRPPISLLKMIKDLCDYGRFDSMAMDVFETTEGDFFINEIQSLFGSYSDYQMKIDGIPGRYRYINDNFIFEKGEFNIMNSNLLRVEDFIKKIRSGYYD